MKNNSTRGYAALGILFLLISLVGILIPTEKTASFWTAYLFTVIAFVAQIFIWKHAWGKQDQLKSKYLGIPLLFVGAVYLTVQIVVFAVFLFVPTLPVWSAAAVSVILVGISALCLISADTGRSTIERIDKKVEQKVFYLKNLQAEVELIGERETDEAVKAALFALAEKFRYSDPMSAEALSELESKITEAVGALRTAADKTAAANEISLLLEERNKKCKLYK